MKKSLKRCLASVVCASMLLNAIPMTTFADEKDGIWSWDVDEIIEMTKTLTEKRNGESGDQSNIFAEAENKGETLNTSPQAKEYAPSWDAAKAQEVMDLIANRENKDSENQSSIYAEAENEGEALHRLKEKEDAPLWNDSHVQEVKTIIAEAENKEPEYYSESGSEIVDQETDQSNDIIASGMCGDAVEWTLSGDGTLTISGSGPIDTDNYGSPWNGFNEKIVSLIIEEGVTSIGGYAFQNCINLVNVQIPDSIDTIGCLAFCNCTSLESIYIPATVVNVDFGAFLFCTSLQRIDVEEGNPTICSVDGVMYSADMVELAFWPAGKSEDVVVEEGVKRISDSAFTGCGMREVILPEGLEVIGMQAFNSCRNLKTISIPASVQEVGYAAFVGCSSLESIDVAVGNSWYCSINNALFYMGNGTTTLVVWPAGNSDSVEIPDSVVEIAPYAFWNCKMTEVVIPGNVRWIDNWAFDSCFDLISIEFTGNAPYITNAFNGVKATCYYPENNATWTQDTLQNYNGEINWVPKKSEGIVVSGMCGDAVKWTLSGDGTLIISGSGSIDTDNSIFPWYYYSGQIVSVIIEEGITSIGVLAFDECTNMKTIAISSSVQKVWPGAFSTCSSLEVIKVAEGNPWLCSINNALFYINENGTTVLVAWPAGNSDSVDIPASVCEIAPYAFWSCKMTEIVIPGTVRGIDRYAFYACQNLTSVIFTGNVPEIYAYAFYEVEATCYYPENNVTWTEDKFQNYDGKLAWRGKHLEGIIASGMCGETVEWTLLDDGTLTISGSGPLDTVNYGTPWRCYNKGQLVSVIIEEGITSIGAYAFEDCNYLVDIQIPDTVDTIENQVFLFCTSLEGITIPASAVNISSDAFFGCLSLQRIDVEEGNPTFCSVDGILYSADMTGLLLCPPGRSEDVVVAEGVKIIYPNAFMLCGISKVTLPEGLEYIATQAFFYCGNLKNISIPASVQMVDPCTFAECHSLESIDVAVGNPWFCSINGALFYMNEDGTTVLVAWPAGNSDSVDLPDSVFQIIPYAFVNCKMKEVVIPERVGLINDGAFYLCPNLTTIRFAGNAPEIANYAFDTITATCYYPENNETWTEEKLQNYGGTITWLSDRYVASGTCGNEVKWLLSNDGTLTISGSGPMDGGSPWYNYREKIVSVIIEEGVTSIGAYAFSECTNLVDVQIPDSVDRIEIMAFLSCTSLESIYIPATVTYIDYAVFPMCTSLKKIEVEEGNPIVCSVDGAMYSTDMFCLVSWPAGKSEDVVVAEGVKRILPMAFAGCGMDEVTLPEGLEYIAVQAFIYCGNLKNIRIPASVAVVEPAVFAECHSLESIDVAEGNPWFSSVNSALLYTSEDGITSLVAWPAGNSNSVDIPNHVNQIFDYGLCCCKMTEVVIPENVGLIGNCVFYFCPNLTSVRFLGNAPEISANAFAEVSATCYYPENNETWTEDRLLNYGGTITWEVYKEPETAIISQPENYTGKVGETATFSVEATGEGLTYQWQFCNAGYDVWRNSSMLGYDTAEITVQITKARIGQKYRCVITDRRGNQVISNEAEIIKFVPALEIISHPENYTGKVGETATFTVEAYGEDLTYQWQYCNAEYNVWRNSSMPGYDTAEITVKITEARIGQKYRCVVTDGNGTQMISNEAELIKFVPELEIISQPEDYTGKVGENATFTVEVVGEGLSYQWQYKAATSNTWRNSGMEGATTSSLIVQLTTARNGQSYRCVITDAKGKTIISEIATLTVN